MLDLKVIAPLSSLSNRTRLFKLATYIYEIKEEKKITHIGWERASGEREEKYLGSLNINKRIILKGGGYGGAKTKVMYIFWMMAVFLYCLLFVNSKSKVWALGFESAFPALLASKIRRYKVIFDDADRFSMVFDFPKPVGVLIEAMEKFTSLNVDCHVVPGTSRYDFYSNRMYTLKNLPSRSVVKRAERLYRKSSQKWPDAKILIYVNGWLGFGRGMGVALDISNYFSGQDVAFIVAGKLDCIEAEELVKKKQVLYVGNISNEEAISCYYASDFVLTYYDPSSSVNRHAESNKWGDAMVTCTAVLVNSEVETAKWLKDIGAAISVPYANSQAIIDELELLLRSPLKINKFKGNIRNYINTRPMFFEDGLAEIFDKLR